MSTYTNNSYIYIVWWHTHDIISGGKPHCYWAVAVPVAYPVALSPVRDRIDGYAQGNRRHPHGGKIKNTYYRITHSDFSVINIVV